MTHLSANAEDRADIADCVEKVGLEVAVGG